ncbi:winged helix-turn-helix domain-containing protein [Shewanella sp. VB17]|uniref:winged helix-turn-helix domain-containing protein n=1 Tax=Shewanella sp. VB17 TaxID=2739432 RepID=UPI001567492B|nr:winged helix-turn-helix domain-containing protein [Shewanella sp. VB17]NRD72959.1 winged helix-turn-helix domain-containing protein [Shewanella sp. VB17]
MGRTYALGKHIFFDKLKGEISYGDNVVNIGGREAAILTILINHKNQVVNKFDINEEVWNEVCVSDASLTKAVSNLRKSLMLFDGLNCEIKTIPKEGYMLVIDSDLVPQHQPVTEVVRSDNKLFNQLMDVVASIFNHKRYQGASSKLLMIICLILALIASIEAITAIWLLTNNFD